MNINLIQVLQHGINNPFDESALIQWIKLAPLGKLKALAKLAHVYFLTSEVKCIKSEFITMQNFFKDGLKLAENGEL